MPGLYERVFLKVIGSRGASRGGRTAPAPTKSQRLRTKMRISRVSEGLFGPIGMLSILWMAAFIRSIRSSWKWARGRTAHPRQRMDRAGFGQTPLWSASFATAGPPDRRVLRSGFLARLHSRLPRKNRGPVHLNRSSDFEGPEPLLGPRPLIESPWIKRRVLVLSVLKVDGARRAIRPLPLG
jgi:hypothetical protein